MQTWLSVGIPAQEALRASCAPEGSSVLVFFFSASPPVGLGRGAQPKTDQGERLSEALAEFELDPVFG
ncbi:hypothetical protein, partial [Polaromonas sp.]|uniref:hypothetical protein n=1 Tax=Polaromonas sp. TaxID=1869339 RepID=UPI003750BC85